MGQHDARFRGVGAPGVLGSSLNASIIGVVCAFGVHLIQGLTTEMAAPRKTHKLFFLAVGYLYRTQGYLPGSLEFILTSSTAIASVT